MFFGSSFLNQINGSELGMRMKTDAQQNNQSLFMELFNRWSNLAITRFDWQNLPLGVDERVLNMGLYLQGSCAFFKHEALDLTALPCTLGNTFNILWQPTSVTVHGFGFSKTLLDPAEFGFVRATPSGIPLAITVYEYTKRMADCLRAIDVLCQRMKRPYVIMANEKQRLTIQNLFKNIKDNEEIIITNKDFPIDGSSFDVAPLPWSGNLTQLWETYKKYERILYTALGINTVDNEKKERVVVDEVNANNMVIEMSNEVSIKEITLCLEDVNRKFGTDISVEMKELSAYSEEDGFNYLNIGGGEDDG